MQQPCHRNRRIGDASDRIDQVVVREARLAAQEHRMQEHASLSVGSRLPEGIEAGVVEVAALAFRQCADH